MSPIQAYNERTEGNNWAKLKYNVLRLSYRKKKLYDMCYSKMCQDWQNEATKIRWMDLVKAASYLMQERHIYFIYCN